MRAIEKVNYWVDCAVRERPKIDLSRSSKVGHERNDEEITPGDGGAMYGNCGMFHP